MPSGEQTNWNVLHCHYTGRIQIKVLTAFSFLFFNFWFPMVQIQNLKGSTGEELILTPQ